MDLRKEQHLLDGTAPNVPTRSSRRAFEADRMLFRLSALLVRVAEMRNEHFTLIVEFLNLGPAEMLRFTPGRKRINAAMVDAQIELCPSVILSRANGKS